ncbi:hypothetical protein DS909_01925 [Phaeobacter gallaeciensis]|uniref:Secreted protein n=1 Tax=Phaeobacter gallaeciensis TaxID=60890 RepID=A0A366X7S8_9RHOB|nr:MULTISPECIES: hypothetical protein [Roseobacteraceae]MBT8168280.1 hypothetical protein [Falsiruegeria litorea]RBW61497.1 hypothetical protein DS909_01925 [Phaeobacter gallaeciensis]
MKLFMTIALCAGSLVALAPAPAEAASGTINRACRASDRPAASRELCGCIQRVANKSLSRTERRKVAKWFADPHQAQQIRMSDRSSDEQLWLRYKAFGQKVHATCR